MDDFFRIGVSFSLHSFPICLALRFCFDSGLEIILILFCILDDTYTILDN